MSSVSTCLWFDNQAEAAASFYTSLVPRSQITGITRYGEAGPGEAGTVVMVTFTLDGVPYQALNGGPHYTLTPAVSISVQCQDQAEVDRYWHALSEGGQPDQCGWITDRFGLSWQIVPAALPRLLADPDAARANRAMQAMLRMSKLDVAALEAAADGR